MLVDRVAAPNPTVSGLVESQISLPPGTSSQIENNSGPLWTDDYSNLLQIIK
jgi:hypothetical protein